MFRSIVNYIRWADKGAGLSLPEIKDIFDCEGKQQEFMSNLPGVAFQSFGPKTHGYRGDFNFIRINYSSGTLEINCYDFSIETEKKKLFFGIFQRYPY